MASREGLSGGVLAHQSEKLLFLRQLSRMFPDAQIIISFRQHSSYINAIYSQYLRYGGTLPLPDFFDLDHDKGLIKRNDIHFKSYVDGIRDYWGRPPFVFLLTELKHNKRQLMTDLGSFFGHPPPAQETLPSRPRNLSLGAKQAEALRRINRFFGIQLHRDGSTRPYRILRRANMDPPSLCQQWTSWSRNQRPIIEPRLAQRIDHYYEDDWAFLQSCVDQRRNLLEAER